jgi:multidrug efflux pump subunit AcrB
VDSVDDLPDEAKVPFVRELKHGERGILLIPVSGADEGKLRVYSKMLRDEVERVHGVARVELGGYREEEIRVSIDTKRLNRFELTVGEVANAIEGRNLNLSAGKIEGTSEIMVRTVAEFETPEDVAAVIVRSNNSGNHVKVGDVAEVRRTVPEGTILERSNGARAIFLEVKKRKSADVIRTTEKVKETVERFKSEYKETGIIFGYTDELAYYVKRRLGVLTNNGLWGMVFVFFCLMAFLNFRTSFLTSMGAPLAFMIAFALMDSVGMNLNLISMFGLILVLGMLVDDAIIVSEHFYQYCEEGLDPKSAARKAAMATVKPVAATIITTMIAFSSLFFMGGIMGKFLWPVPAVVILCLLASWFECFFILPNHLAEFGRGPKSNKKKWYDPLIRNYKKILAPALKYYKTSIFVFFVVFILTLIQVKRMPFELFPGDDVRILMANIKGPVGVPLAQTDNVMRELEGIVEKNLSNNELEQTRTWVGKYRTQRGTRTGSHYGSLIVYLTPPDERERSTDQIVDVVNEKARALPDGFELNISKQQGGPPKGKAVDIELNSDSLKDLKLASGMILDELKKREGVISPEVDFESGKKQFVATVNDAEARRLGLSTKQVAFEIRRALAGDAITEIRESDEDIDVVVILNKNGRKDLKNLKNLYVLNSKGNRIGLQKMVTFKEMPGAFVIRRKNAKRTFSVQSDLNKEITTPIKMVKEMTPVVNKVIKEFPGMTFSFGGENEDTRESMLGLAKAGIIALAGIFFVLVAMFGSLAQPIIIMSTIPLGLIGVVVTFTLSGWAIGFMAFMGMVGLIGVVVNDSIVLVNHINVVREEDSQKSLHDSILGGATARFRAVLLTTVTTVSGLLPIALAKGGDPFLKPMALSFAGGLFFSTAVTLVFVPCAYMAQVKLKVWISSLFRKGPKDPPARDIPQRPKIVGL